MRICFACKTRLPMRCFSKDRTRKNGLSFRCRSCVSKMYKLWREKNKARLTSKEHKVKRNELAYKYMKKYPEKQRARASVAYALKHGKIQKLPCQTSGCKDKKVHAHHPDYSKPLKVIWLCVPHHEAIHHKV